MKKNCILMTLFFTLCFVFASTLCMPNTALAKGITKVSQAKKLAKKQVAGARSIKVEKDRDDGVLVYQVQLLKGKKEYELIYRASDSKLLSFGWEIQDFYVKKGTGKLIGITKCKALAKKQVANGKIVSAVKKRSDGIDLYDIKMQKGSKKYELKYHARTGKLLEYEWELTSKEQNSGNNSNYIGTEQAKSIAASHAGFSVSEVRFQKAKLDKENGKMVYEVEFYKDGMEYEYEIDAVTGKIIKFDQEWDD